MSTIAVAIASLGRPETVAENLAALRRQTRTPDRILFSVTSPADLPPDFNEPDVEVTMGSKGLTRQRNRALEKLRGEVDYIMFFDDDYVPSRYAVQRIAEYFDQNPEIVGVMGDTLADGIKGPGIPYEEACEIVETYDAHPRPPIQVIKEETGLYGCNMGYRTSAVGETRFDEHLPFYGWLEDNDFSNQLLKHGRLVHTTAFAGVHCGVKSARSPGLRLGYSQIANPIYLGRKGTLPWPKAANLMSRNFLANHFKSLKPEPWIDRWGRVKGNWLALRHIISGKLDPKHISKL